MRLGRHCVGPRYCVFGALPQMRVQRFLGVARLALLALAHPVDFGQWAQYTGPVCAEAVAVEYASRARARRYGVRRSEGMGGGRHGAVVERPRWKLIQTRVETQPYACLPGQERVTRRRRSSRAPKVCSEACMRWNGNAMRAELTVRCCVQIETDEALGCAR
jgi:hypothetical protein